MFLQTSWKTSAKDDLYLEEDGILEGSGSDREVKSDLESSGSGYGPGEDDEDGEQGSGAVDREFVLCVDNAQLDTHFFIFTLTIQLCGSRAFFIY